MTDDYMPGCYWFDGGRLLKHRHIVEHLHIDDCDGCTPCPRRHCAIDGSTHDAAGLCPRCLGKIRADLAEIVRLDSWAETMAMLNGPRGEHEGGLPLGGEPMVLLGPVAPFADDDEPMPPPAVILIGWEYAMRHTLGQPTALRPTLSRAVDYIGAHLRDVADTGKLDVGLLAEMVGSARAHLEDVVHDGLRDAAGAPCVRCGRLLVRVCSPTTGLSDAWSCSSCRISLTDTEYRYLVDVVHRHHAPALTAAEIEERLGVRASIVRVWGSRGLIDKRGRTAEGLTIYDVEQVAARLNREDTA